MNNKKSNNNQLLMTLLKGRTFIVLVLLVIFFTIVKGTTFLSASTLTMVAKHVALYGILALGMTFVIITRGIDLSVGSVVGLVVMLAGGRYHSEICRCNTLFQCTGNCNCHVDCWMSDWSS